MTINSINGASTQIRQMGMNQETDSYSRNIQNQISNARKQLQELSSNEDMTLEDKMKRRQEIQQQKQSSNDDMYGDAGNTGNANEGSESAGLSEVSMTAMITAGTSMKQAKAQGSVVAKEENRAEVLKSEIKLDKFRRGNTQKKQEELSDVEQNAQAAVSSQLSSLADTSKTMEEAVKEEAKVHRADESAQPTEDSLTVLPTTYTSVDIRL